ncbi:hypothetical protein ACFLZN_00225 [Nanoarchaeota archaeon]
MKISSDVNTIFGYSDLTHKLSKAVRMHMAKTTTFHYVLLCEVKKSFVFTYSDYLKSAGETIDLAVRKYIAERKKAVSKSYKPSNAAISSNVRSKIKDHITSQKKQFLRYNVRAVNDFVNKMLTDFSIPELVEDSEKFAAFREKYVEGAEKLTKEVLNKFLRFYREVSIKKTGDYSKLASWLEKIKNGPNELFDNKKDFEDMKIAAEFFAYNDELGLLGFFSGDNEFCKSINKFAENSKIRIGNIEFIS